MPPTTNTLRGVMKYIQGELTKHADDANVHEYERLVRTREDLINIAGHTNEAGNTEIHGWSITIEGDGAEGDTEFDDTPDVTYVRSYNIVMRGYYGLDDIRATGILWQEIIEGVLDGFDSDPTLGGNANFAEPITARVRDQHREFGNILVHYCELVMVVRLRRDRL